MAARGRGRRTARDGDARCAKAVDDRLVLVTALGRLPPRRRACLVLRYYEELSVRDTANALGCSGGTVKSQTADGLGDLRRALGEMDAEGRESLSGGSPPPSETGLVTACQKTGPEALGMALRRRPRRCFVDF